MSLQPKICLIGDIVIDVTLKTASNPTKVRLGGIVHAARCLWALNVPFAVGYFAPSYIDDEIVRYLNSLECHDIFKLGTIKGAPFVFLIEEVKEAGDQGYEFLLRDQIEIEYDAATLENIVQSDIADFLLISGNYDIKYVTDRLKGNIHIDLANNIKDFSLLKEWPTPLSTIFLSTSSDLFKNFYDGDFESFSVQFRSHTQRLILKENRGGSRGMDLRTNEMVTAPAQTRPVHHSVGVGDVFDACFTLFHSTKSFQEALVLSSWMAAEYAMTTFPDDFKLGVDRVLKSDIRELVKLGGVVLHWEQREKINIYIAAPDFDFVDASPIDKLVNSLKYHNFNPRRPIKEHGQMEAGATKERKQEFYRRDLNLLSECSILIAVMLYNDPGTLIEIGLAAARGMPTLVYDPFNQATNCMLTELPTLVSNELDEIIAEVFIRSNQFSFYEK